MLCLLSLFFTDFKGSWCKNSLFSNLAHLFKVYNELEYSIKFTSTSLSEFSCCFLHQTKIKDLQLLGPNSSSLIGRLKDDVQPIIFKLKGPGSEKYQTISVEQSQSSPGVSLEGEQIFSFHLNKLMVVMHVSENIFEVFSNWVSEMFYRERFGIEVQTERGHWREGNIVGP